MPIYRYKGFKADGSAISGTIEADGKREAVRGVKEKGIFPDTVREELSRKTQRLFFKKDGSALPHLTFQLSLLLSSGVPLIDAIKSLSEQRKGLWKGVLVSMRERVSSGLPLSRAMEDFSDIFPDYYINMVSAGETGGRLDSILERLSHFLESQEDIKTQIRNASIYPLFLSLVGMAVLFFVFLFVVPKITKIFADSEAALPLITVILIEVSRLLQSFWWLFFAIVIFLWYGVKLFIKKKSALYGSILYRVPLLKTLYMARFLRITGFLLQGGVPVLRALQLSAKSAGNRFIEEYLLETERNVAEGASLSTSIGIFPPVVKQIVSTGERGGNLAETMLKAAGAYEKEFAMSVRRYLSMIEPVMILIMGLIIAFIVFAVLLPIFELNQLIQ